MFPPLSAAAASVDADHPDEDEEEEQGVPTAVLQVEAVDDSDAEFEDDASMSEVDDGYPLYEDADPKDSEVIRMVYYILSIRSMFEFAIYTYMN